MDQKKVLDLLNPIRIKIIQAVLKKGQATSKDISESLPDVAIASLYRHIKKLIELDVLEVISETQIRGTVERLFKLKYNPFEEIEKSFDNGDSSYHFQIFYTFLISQLLDFSDYLSTPYDMYDDMIGFRTYPFYLSKKESKDFYQEISDVLKKYIDRDPSPDRNLMKFSFSMMPSKDK